MKKISKIFIIMLACFALFMLCNKSFAGVTTNINTGDYQPKDEEAPTQVTNIASTVLGIVRAIGTVISVGVLSVLGIKYMTGSVEERADYKSSMLPYIIGAVLLFASTTFVQLIYNVVKSIK